MRILLTNDDGITSAGLRLLATALRKAGHRVFVLAPDSDRSGVSHSVSFFRSPCKLVEVEPDTWSCTGTPADCVVLGILGGIPELRIVADNDSDEPPSPPELILSGINRGANIGTDILYSGTAAAARQGSLCDIPSVAVSLIEGDVWHWDMAVEYVVDHIGEMRAFWKADSFVNVNIPNGAVKPSALVPAFPSIRYYNDRIENFEAPDGHRYCFTRVGEIGAKPEDGSDWDVVLKKQASISAICIHPVLIESVNGRG